MQEIKSIQGLGSFLAQTYGSQPQETCRLIAVNSQLQILEISTVALGTVNQVQIHPRDIFRRLVSLNAYGFIIAHNHPSGQLKASRADWQAIYQLALCSSIMQIVFLDFIIINRSHFCSHCTLKRWPKITLETLLGLWTTMTKL